MFSLNWNTILCVCVVLDLCIAQYAFFDMGYDNPLRAIWNRRRQGYNEFNDNQPIMDRYNCMTYENNNHTGICMQAASCKFRQGISYGSNDCGVWSTCCVFKKTSNQTSNARVTYFVNPSNPRSRPQPQRLQINLLPNICQLRVDIIDMNLNLPTIITSPPVSMSKCSDIMYIEPSYLDNTIPELCGKNKNKHFYVHLDENTSNQGTFTLAVNLVQDTSTTVNVQPTWDVKVTQLECPENPQHLQYQRISNKQSQSTKHKVDLNQLGNDFYKLAPRNCLQYFTEPSGEFSNFGFLANADSSLTSGQDYAICFKRQPGSCGVLLTRIFIMLRNSNTSPNTCPNEYLLIPESNVANTDNGKICRSTTTTLYDSTHPGPLYVHFYSDVTLGSTAISTYGFHFKYEMIRCPRLK